MKKSIELFNVNIDLQPAKNWRDLAASGRKSMSYKIFGHAKAEDGSVIAVSASVGAITAEGVIGDLGTAEVPAVSGLLAKNDPRLDTAALKFGPDGQPVRNEDGTPVYDEAPIVCEDGSEFDLAYGTLFFVTLLPGIRLVLDGAELSPSLSNGAQRFAKDSKGNKTIPVFDAAVDGIRVERRAVVSGPGLLGRVRVVRPREGRPPSPPASHVTRPRTQPPPRKSPSAKSSEPRPPAANGGGPFHFKGVTPCHTQ